MFYFIFELEKNIFFPNNAKNLGVYLSGDLCMECHITYICKSIYLEIRTLKQMSNFIYENSLKTFAASFILSKLDYCNSLFKNTNIGFSKNSKNSKISLQR